MQSRDESDRIPECDEAFGEAIGSARVLGFAVALVMVLAACWLWSWVLP